MKSTFAHFRKKSLALMLVFAMTVSVMAIGNASTAEAASTPSATSITDLTGYSKAFIAEWKKVSGVTGYQIQYSKTTSFSTVGNYYVSGASNTEAVVNTVKYGNTKYYVRIRTYKKSGSTYTYSSWSSVKSVKTKSTVTAFGGDSLTVGLSGVSSSIDIDSSYKFAAIVGINVSNFYSPSSSTWKLNGKSCYQTIVDAQPYRVYIMLGMNEANWISTSTAVSNYTKLVQKIQKNCPATDIVLLSVTPVQKSNSYDMSQSKINSYNKNVVKAVASACGVDYYSIASEFKNSSGYLLSKYANSDGLHMNTAGYKKMASLLSDYDAERDSELKAAAKTK